MTKITPAKTITSLLAVGENPLAIPVEAFNAKLANRSPLSATPGITQQRIRSQRRLGFGDGDGDGCGE